MTQVHDSIPIVARASGFTERSAVVAADGQFSYGHLLDLSARVGSCLLDGRPDLEEARVAFLVRPSMAHIYTQWGIWRGGGMTVPLCVDHPAPELEYVLDDSQASIVIADPEFEPLLRPLAERRKLRFALVGELATSAPVELPAVEASRRADVDLHQWDHQQT